MAYYQLYYHLVWQVANSEPFLTATAEPAILDYLRWADDFGALTFDGKRLPYVIAYVEQQKAHHAAGTTIPVLERVDDRPLDRGTLRELPVAYTAETEMAAWWKEMMSLE